MTVNQLHINYKKCHYIHFEPSKARNTSTCSRTIYCDHTAKNKYKIQINGTTFKQVTQIKFLGVILDENLSWIPHIDNLVKKLKSCIGALNRIKTSIPKKLYSTIYHSLFESHLSYCISVWGGVGQNKLEKVFTTQKKCIRILFGDLEKFLDKYKTCARTRPRGEQILGSAFYSREHSKPLFNTQKMLTVHNLYIYHCCLEIFKILKFRTPISLYSRYSCSKRKPTLILTKTPSMHFIHKSAVILSYNNAFVV